LLLECRDALSFINSAESSFRSAEVGSYTSTNRKGDGGYSMSAEENKALVRRFVEELWHAKNYRIVDELCVPEFVAHDLPAGIAANREGFKKVAAVMHNAFPDIRFTTEDVIAEKDKVVIRWDSTGTHKGEFMGIPATNKRVSRNGVTIYRTVGGKIVEWWNKSDLLAMLMQLGAIPTPSRPRQ